MGARKPSHSMPPGPMFDNRRPENPARWQCTSDRMRCWDVAGQVTHPLLAQPRTPAQPRSSGNSPMLWMQPGGGSGERQASMQHQQLPSATPFQAMQQMQLEGGLLAQQRAMIRQQVQAQQVCAHKFASFTHQFTVPNMQHAMQFCNTVHLLPLDGEVIACDPATMVARLSSWSMWWEQQPEIQSLLQ